MHEVVQQWHNQPGKKNKWLLKRLMLSRQETIRWIRLGFYKPRGPKNSRDDPEKKVPYQCRRISGCRFSITTTGNTSAKTKKRGKWRLLDYNMFKGIFQGLSHECNLTGLRWLWMGTRSPWWELQSGNVMFQGCGGGQCKGMSKVQQVETGALVKYLGVM